MTQIGTRSGIRVRPIEPSDNLALRQLLESSPDTGLISFAIRYKVHDVYRVTQLLRPGNYGLLAFLPGVDEPVGQVYADASQVTMANSDQLWPSVILNSLAVQPQYRRRGVADALTKNIQDWISTTYGKDVLSYAYIQKNNTGSLANVAKYNPTLTERVQWNLPVKTGSQPVQLPSNLQVREANREDWPAIVAGLNQFYRPGDFYQPKTLKTIEEWQQPVELDGQIFNMATYYVITDLRGEIKAGVGVRNENSLYEIKVKGPRSLNLLNKFIKLIPPDGILKPATAHLIWYKGGHFDAAQYLWQEVRRRVAQYSNTLRLSFDPTSPLKPVFNLPFYQPVVKAQLILLNTPSGLNLTDGGNWLAS